MGGWSSQLDQEISSEFEVEKKSISLKIYSLPYRSYRYCYQLFLIWSTHFDYFHKHSNSQWSPYVKYLDENFLLISFYASYSARIIIPAEQGMRPCPANIFIMSYHLALLSNNNITPSQFLLLSLLFDIYMRQKNATLKQHTAYQPNKITGAPWCLKWTVRSGHTRSWRVCFKHCPRFKPSTNKFCALKCRAFMPYELAVFWSIVTYRSFKITELRS